MRQYLVYLAGPITGLSFDGCTNWREWFIDRLPKEIIGLSPMRGKDYLEAALEECRKWRMTDEECEELMK